MPCEDISDRAWEKMTKEARAKGGIPDAQVTHLAKRTGCFCPTCRSTGTPTEGGKAVSHNVGETSRVEEGVKSRFKDRLDGLAQKLCYVCGCLENAGMMATMPPIIQDWWSEHQGNDFKRVLDQMCSSLQERKWERLDELVAEFINRAEAVHPVSDYHKDWFLGVALRARDKVPMDRRPEW